jgi:hypothetical protein
MAGFASDVPLDLTVDGEDLFPADPETQRDVVSYVQRKFKMAETARKPHEDRWLKHYKMFRSFVAEKKPGMWRSQRWIPITFTIIQTILPRLCASLPSPVVNPVGPEDVDTAETMEELLKWAEDKSELYAEQVKAVESSLIYGTGVLKIGYGEKRGFNIRQEPVMEQTIQSVATGEVDIDGNPMMQEMPGEPTPKLDENGEPVMQTVREEYLTYAGPIAEAVDLANFFPDPMGDDVQSCRYVIHRVYRDAAHIQAKIKDGTYKVPDPEHWRRFLDNRTTHAALDRLAEIERGSGYDENGSDRDYFPLLEFHTKDVVITIAGENAEGILLRAERNPMAHGEIPFVRIVDHVVPHEFWGIGEVEPIEGLQEVLNEIWNSRIDNVKLVMNKMFAVVADYMMDPSELVVRPGQVVRMREGLPLEQVFKEMDFGEITGSAYTEAAEIERETEKTSGVSPYQTGQDSPAYNRTATGVALISEQGNTRFSFKVQLAEHTGYKHLMRQYAAVLQQFLPEDLVLRIKGGEVEKKFQQAQMAAQAQMQQMVAAGYPPEQAQMQAQMFMQQMMIDPATGMPLDPMGGWKLITQESINGRFDYEILPESSTQTVSSRREQTLSMYSAVANDPYFKPRKPREDLLREFGRKNVDDYLLSDFEISMMQQQQAMAEQESEGPPGQEQ